MSEKIRNKVVPKLQFPEFMNSGEWEETTLQHKADYENGKAHENNISESGKFIVVNSKFISSNGQVRKFTNNGFCVADKGDILMVLSDVPNGKAIAKCFYVDTDNTYTVNQRVCKLKPKKAVGLLLYYILNRNPYFLAFDDGVKQTNLKNDDVLNCPIVIPKAPQEQQKIADCLSSLDDLITAQKQKLEALKTHKKGLMQQLFPAEGETVPKLRFAEFRESGVWEEKTLGECLLKHPEYGINAPAVPYSHDLPTYLRITDISIDGMFLKNQMVSVGQKVTDDNYLQEGDIVLARTGASVGKSYKYRIEDGALVFAGFLIRVKPSKEKLNSEFFFQYLFTGKYWKWVNFTSTRSGQPGINGNEYALLPISLPPTLAEQRKIGDTLSSLDKLMTAQKEKIEALKVHKKGLMQQLFPNTVL